MTDYKHSALNEIFNAAFWSPDVGAYVAPATLEEIEERFNRVIAGLAALYEIPTSGSDASPRLRADGVPTSAIQEQLRAFYASDLDPAFVATLGTPVTKPCILEELPAAKDARDGILEQLGAPMANGQPGVLKFSLNVPALQRLIGGDSAVEIELRKSIVQEFAKRHLTAVANEWKGEIAEEKQRLFDEVFNTFCTQSSWGSRTLSADARELVSAHVKTAVDYYAKTTVQEAAQAIFAGLMPQLDAKIEAAMNQAIAKAVNEQVKEKALAAITAALG